MSWSELDDYQRLIREHPKLQNTAAQQSFERYMDNMWEKPTSYAEIMQAYLEFSTSDKLTFPKLKALRTASQSGGAKKSRRRRSRRSRRKRKSRSKN